MKPMMAVKVIGDESPVKSREIRMEHPRVTRLRRDRTANVSFNLATIP